MLKKVKFVRINWNITSQMKQKVTIYYIKMFMLAWKKPRLLVLALLRLAKPWKLPTLCLEHRVQHKLLQHLKRDFINEECDERFHIALNVFVCKTFSILSMNLKIIPNNIKHTFKFVRMYHCKLHSF